MALTTCPECSAQVSDKAAACPSCGYPLGGESESPQENQQSVMPQAITVRKSRGVFIILGVLFGLLGIHNFYAGFYGQGATQLVLGLVTIALPWMFAIPLLTAFILFVWIIADLFMTTHDSSGLKLA